MINFLNNIIIVVVFFSRDPKHFKYGPILTFRACLGNLGLEWIDVV
jgi:hypothetical protein